MPTSPVEIPRLASLPREFANVRPYAEGGFSWVYLAEQTELSRTEVIKLLRRDKPGLTPDAFLREGRVLARLNHKNICKVFDVKTCADGPYLRMEYVDGPTVRDYVRTRPLMLSQVIKLTIGLASALDHAHRKGIIHGDLKPENILIDRGTDEPKLIDFGIARRLESERHGRSGLHQRSYGTPAYVAPEQTYGEPPTPLSDLYSLGVILFELVTGHLPFTGDKGELLEAHRTAPIPRLPARLGVLQPILDSMLEKTPGRRMQSLWELAEALKSLKSPDGMLDFSPATHDTGPLGPVVGGRRRDPEFVTEAFDVDLLAPVTASPPVARPTPSPQPVQGYPEGNEILQQARQLRIQLEAGSGILPKGQLYFRFCEWAEGAHSIEDVQVVQDLLELTMRELGNYAPEFANVESHLRKRQRDLLLQMKRNAAVEALSSSRQAADRHAWLPPITPNAFDEAQRAHELDPNNPDIVTWIEELAERVASAVAGLIRHNAYEAGRELTVRALEAFPEHPQLLGQRAAIDAAILEEARRGERDSAMRQLAAGFDRDPLAKAGDAVRSISELSAADLLLPGASALTSELARWLRNVASQDSLSAVAAAQDSVGEKWDALKRVANLVPAIVEFERRREQLALQARKDARKAELIELLSARMRNPTDLLGIGNASFIEAYGCARAEGFETEAVDACKAAAPALARIFAEVSRSKGDGYRDLDRWMEAAEHAKLPAALIEGLAALRDRMHGESLLARALHSATDRLNLGIDAAPELRDAIAQVAALGKLPPGSPIASALRTFGDALLFAIRHCREAGQLADLARTEHWLSASFQGQMGGLCLGDFAVALTEAAARVKAIELERTALVEAGSFLAKPSLASLEKFLGACRAVDPVTEALAGKRLEAVARIEQELHGCLRRGDWRSFEDWLIATAGLASDQWRSDRRAALAASQVREQRRQRQESLLSSAASLEKAQLQALETAIAQLLEVPLEEVDDAGTSTLANAVAARVHDAADDEIERLDPLLRQHAQALSPYQPVVAAGEALHERLLERRRADDRRRLFEELVGRIRAACESDDIFEPGNDGLLAVLGSARSVGFTGAQDIVEKHALTIEAAIDRALITGHSTTRLRQWIAESAGLIPPSLATRLAQIVQSAVDAEVERRKFDKNALQVAREFLRAPQGHAAEAARVIAHCTTAEMLLPGSKVLVDALAEWLAGLARGDALPPLANARDALIEDWEALKRVPTLAEAIAEFERRHRELAAHARRQSRKSEILERLQASRHNGVEWLDTGAGSFLESIGLARANDLASEADEACRNHAAHLAAAVTDAARGGESGVERVDTWLQVAAQIGIPENLISGLRALSERGHRHWRVEQTLQAAAAALASGGGTEEGVCIALRQARNEAPLAAASPVAMAVSSFGVALLAAITNCGERKRLDALGRLAELASLAAPDPPPAWSTELGLALAEANSRVSQREIEEAARGFTERPTLKSLMQFIERLHSSSAHREASPELIDDLLKRVEVQLLQLARQQQWDEFNSWLEAASGVASDPWLAGRRALRDDLQLQNRRRASQERLHASAVVLTGASRRDALEAALQQLSDVPVTESDDSGTQALAIAIAERIKQASEDELDWLGQLLANHAELVARHDVVATADGHVRKQIENERRLAETRRHSEEVLTSVRIACTSAELFHRGKFGLLSTLKRARDEGVSTAGSLVSAHLAEIELAFRRALGSDGHTIAELQSWLDDGKDLLPTNVVEALTEVIQSAPRSDADSASLVSLRAAFKLSPQAAARDVVLALAATAHKTHDYHRLLADLSEWLSSPDFAPSMIADVVGHIPPNLATEAPIRSWSAKFSQLVHLQELGDRFAGERTLRSFVQLADQVEAIGYRPGWLDHSVDALKEIVDELRADRQDRLLKAWLVAAQKFLGRTEFAEICPGGLNGPDGSRGPPQRLGRSITDSASTAAESSTEAPDIAMAQRHRRGVQIRGIAMFAFACLMLLGASFYFGFTGPPSAQRSTPSGYRVDAIQLPPQSRISDVDRATLDKVVASLEKSSRAFTALALREDVDVSRHLRAIEATVKLAERAVIDRQIVEAVGLYQRARSELELEHQKLVQQLERQDRNSTMPALDQGDIEQTEAQREAERVRLQQEEAKPRESDLRLEQQQEAKRKADEQRARREGVKPKDEVHRDQQTEVTRQRREMARIEVLTGYDCQLLISPVDMSKRGSVSEKKLVAGARFVSYLPPGQYNFSCLRSIEGGGQATALHSFSAGQVAEISFALSDFAVSTPTPAMTPVASAKHVHALVPENQMTPVRSEFPFVPVVKKLDVGPVKFGSETRTALLLDIEWRNKLVISTDGTYSARGTLVLTADRRRIPMEWGVSITVTDGVAIKGALELGVGYVIENPRHINWLEAVSPADVLAEFEVSKWIEDPRLVPESGAVPRD